MCHKSWLLIFMVKLSWRSDLASRIFGIYRYMYIAFKDIGTETYHWNTRSDHHLDSWFFAVRSFTPDFNIHGKSPFYHILHWKFSFGTSRSVLLLSQYTKLLTLLTGPAIDQNTSWVQHTLLLNFPWTLTHKRLKNSLASPGLACKGYDWCSLSPSLFSILFSCGMQHKR